MIVQALIDEDSHVVPLGMESTALFDVYRDESCKARPIMAMKPASLPIRIENTIKPINDSPIAPAAYERNLPLIPMNSKGRCKPLKTG